MDRVDGRGPKQSSVNRRGIPVRERTRLRKQRRLAVKQKKAEFFGGRGTSRGGSQSGILGCEKNGEDSNRKRNREGPQVSAEDGPVAKKTKVSSEPVSTAPKKGRWNSTLAKDSTSFQQKDFEVHSEDELLEYVEKSLGIRGDEKKRKQLTKSIGINELGGDDLLDFVDKIVIGDATKPIHGGNTTKFNDSSGSISSEEESAASAADSASDIESEAKSEPDDRKTSESDGGEEGAYEKNEEADGGSCPVLTESLSSDEDAETCTDYGSQTQSDEEKTDNHRAQSDAIVGAKDLTRKSVQSKQGKCKSQGQDASDTTNDGLLESDLSDNDKEDGFDDDGNPSSGMTNSSVKDRTQATVDSSAGGKYVPPHLRANPSASAADNSSATKPSASTSIISLRQIIADVRSTVTSGFNRVSEGNLNIVLDSLIQQYDNAVTGCGAAVSDFNKSTGQFNNRSPKSSSSFPSSISEFNLHFAELVADAAFSFLEHHSVANLTAAQVGLLVAIAGTLNPKVLSYYLSKTCRLLGQGLTQLKAFCEGRYKAKTVKQPTQVESEAPTFAGEDVGSRAGGKCRQALTAISFLAYFGALDIDLIIAMGLELGGQSPCRNSRLRLPLHNSDEPPEFTTKRLEFLAHILRLTHMSLREVGMEEKFTNITKPLFEKISAEDKLQSDFLRHEVSSLDKLRHSPIFQKYLNIKKWLSNNPRFRAVDWDQIAFSVPAEIEDHNDLASLTFPGSDQSLVAVGIVVSDLLAGKFIDGTRADVVWRERPTGNTSSNGSGVGGSIDYLALAKRLKIKTPLQQQAFVALISAYDVDDAILKLVKVCNKRSSMPYVIAVILHCAVQEGTYNEYYEQVLMKLCSLPDPRLNKAFGRAIRQGLHSMLGTLAQRGQPKDRQRLTRVKTIAKCLIDGGVIPQVDGLLQKLEETQDPTK